MSNEILALREHLVTEKVTCVVMESTGDYWKPFYYLLEDALNVMLVNPRDARNRPGRKTDVSDAAWLADLGAHGLLRASLVPPPPIRRLRDLTRARTDLNRDRTRQIHRLEKILQDAGIKLSSVATDIMGQSSRAMLEALIEGKADPAAMADLAKRRMRSKIPALTEALTGRFTPVIGGELTAAERLAEITGLGQVSAHVIIAEIGLDMTRFPDGRSSGVVGESVPAHHPVRAGAAWREDRQGESVSQGSAG